MAGGRPVTSATLRRGRLRSFAFERQFVLLFKGPETLFGGFYCGGAQRVDVAVNTWWLVMTGPLCGNYALPAAHAAGIDGHDGVAAPVLVVNLPRPELQPLASSSSGGDHVLNVLTSPAFVGECGGGKQRRPVNKNRFSRESVLFYSKGLAYHKPLVKYVASETCALRF